MHIAVLEDDPDQRDLLELLLGQGSHTSRGFGLTADFVEGTKRERFDLLLIDWMLPDGTGAEVLQWVRQSLGWDVPVVVVTGRSPAWRVDGPRPRPTRR